MTGVVIRPMTVDERTVVADLLVQSNAEHLDAFPPAIARAYRDEIVDLESRAATSVTLVAVGSDGEIVGSVTYLPDAADDGHPWPEGGGVIRFLAVPVARRGDGLGTTLVRACIERALQDRRSFLGLHTAPMMTAARGLYSRLGFERTPVHDFDPADHYGGAVTDDLWGCAYMLRLP